MCWIGLFVTNMNEDSLWARLCSHHFHTLELIILTMFFEECTLIVLT